MDDTLNLVALAKPLKPVTLPNGTVCPVRVMDAAGFELYQRAKETGADADGAAVLRYILPTATDDDLGSLGEEDAIIVVSHAMRKTNAVLAALQKKDDAPPAAALRPDVGASGVSEAARVDRARPDRATPRSSRRTTRATSAPASGASGAATTSTS